LSFSIYPQQELESIFSNIYGSWQGAAAGLIIVIIGLWAFSKTLKTKESPRVIYKSTSLGQYMISFAALESMVIKAAKNIEGFKDLQPGIIARDNKLSVQIKGSIAEGYQIPDLCEKVQEEVKNYLEEMSGITIEAVRVFVENVAPDNTSRPVK
ncbi:MAG: alkaline shock response membrane anchor protein AmaP, partial [Candidatus Syntrophonatronum acetioxidans]